jgi:hypothetical protein
MQSRANSLRTTTPGDHFKASGKPSRFLCLINQIPAWLLQCPFLVAYITIVGAQLDQIAGG